MARVSVVLSTYKKPRELDLALAALLAARRQGIAELEILVADDGSGAETAAVVERRAREAPVAVRHVWHEDRGFRLAAIRNRAIRESRGEVIIFADGDSLVDPRALLLHARRCRPGAAHTGGRVRLDAAASQRLLDGEWTLEAACHEVVPRDRWRRRWEALKNLVYQATRLKTRPKLCGGNCAVHRVDLERANGFDERFVGWGREDDDLARRLRRLRVRIADGARDCLVLHLFHEVHLSHWPSVHHTENFRYYNRGGYLARCRQGLRHRPLGDVAFAIEGDIPPALGELPRLLGSARPGEAAEVVVRFPGATRRRPERGAEMVIDVPDPGAAGSGNPVAWALSYIEERV